MDRNNLKKLGVHHFAPYFLLKPSSLFISPTLRCNSRCSHCDVWKGKGDSIKELSYREWQKILSDNFFKNINALWLSGGEPTLRKDIPEIAVHAINSLPRLESITLATNAFSPSLIKNFLQRTLSVAGEKKKYIHLHISLDGPPIIHDTIRGIEGAFSSLQKTVEFVKQLNEKYPLLGFSFNCVIQEKNLSFLEEIYNIARRLGGNITFNLQETRKSFYHSESIEQINGDDRKKIVGFLTSILNDCDVFYRRHYETIICMMQGYPRPHHCETLEATFYVDPDGAVYSCPVAYRNTKLNLLEVSPATAWKKLFELKKEIRKRYCPTCLLGCSFGEGLSITELIKQYLMRG